MAFHASQLALTSPVIELDSAGERKFPRFTELIVNRENRVQIGSRSPFRSLSGALTSRETRPLALNF